MPVRWRETMLALHELGAERFVEVGPGRVLTGLRQADPARRGARPCLRRRSRSATAGASRAHAGRGDPVGRDGAPGGPRDERRARASGSASARTGSCRAPASASGAGPARTSGCRDYAARAGARALDRAGVDAADIDLVLVATLTQDELTPNTAPIVAHALGATRAGAIDVGAACTAFLSGLALGAGQIESGPRRASCC